MLYRLITVRKREGMTPMIAGQKADGTWEPLRDASLSLLLTRQGEFQATIRMLEEVADDNHTARWSEIVLDKAASVTLAIAIQPQGGDDGA